MNVAKAAIIKAFSTLFIISLLMALPLVALSQSESTTSGSQAGDSSVKSTAPWYDVSTVSMGDRVFNDFVVSPGKVEVDIERGETRVVNIMVTNRIDRDSKFKIEVEDFGPTNNLDQTIQLYGDAVGPYPIKDWITFPEYSFTLGFGQRAVLPVTISVPANAEPGGRYGSVLISTVKIDEHAELDGNVGPRSPVVARTGTLFFIRIPGDTKIEGSLSDFATNLDKLWYETGPIEFGIVYENTGSLHLNPYGEVSIKNMFGDEVGFIELEPWFVLPQSLRLKEFSWDREFLLGRYTAELRLNRGYNDIIDEASISFWVLPWKFLVAIFAGVFVFVFIIRFFIRNFEFKRRR